MKILYLFFAEFTCFKGWTVKRPKPKVRIVEHDLQDRSKPEGQGDNGGMRPGRLVEHFEPYTSYFFVTSKGHEGAKERFCARLDVDDPNESVALTASKQGCPGIDHEVDLLHWNFKLTRTSM